MIYDLMGWVYYKARGWVSRQDSPLSSVRQRDRKHRSAFGTIRGAHFAAVQLDEVAHD